MGSRSSPTITAATEQQSKNTGFVCPFSTLISSAKLLSISLQKRGNVFLQRIVPKSSVFCHRRDNHGHVYKNIGMAEESEPERRTVWETNNGFYTRSRWRRNTRGKNRTGKYSKNNKDSSRARRTLRYWYKRLLFTFSHKTWIGVHPCKTFKTDYLHF